MIVAGVALCAHATGQTTQTTARPDQPASQPSPDPLAITGRDFAGVRFPLAPTPGRIALAAQRVWSWTEPAGASTPGRSPEPVHRLVLEGDVRITLGSYDFSAARAVVWLKRLPAEETDERRIYQVYVYFDRVATPQADPAVAISADRLPVEGIIVVPSRIELQADLLYRTGAGGSLIDEAELVLAGRLRDLLGMPGIERIIEPPRRPGRDPRDGRPFLPSVDPHATPALAVDRAIASLQPVDEPEPIFASSGIISFVPGPQGQITGVRGEAEDSAIITGGVVVFYEDPITGRSLEMSAQRAVVFLPPGTMTGVLSGLTPDAIRGIYLEGDVVITDGHYTLRGPRVYYDLKRDRAVVLDAVFWTYNEQLGLPLFVRAEAIRQESADQFSAKRMRLTNSGFAKPSLAIGTETVTLTRSERADGSIRNRIEAQHITLRAGGVPFFYWPGFAGDPQEMPLRSLTIDGGGGSGGAIRTIWNADSLLKLGLPEGVELDLLNDTYFERGFALGTELRWKTPDREGSILAYVIPQDRGEDRLRTGRDLSGDNDTRGMVIAEDRWDIDDQWTLWAEGAFFSDETFIDGFFDPLSSNRRPFRTGAYLRQRDANTAVVLEVTGQINDFLVNEFVLQTPGYVTQKLPEVRYVRLADDLLASIAPGLVTYFSEYTASRVQLSFADSKAGSLGFTSKSLSQRAFGIDPDESIADRLRAMGLTEDPVLRADTRHELVATLQAGPVTISPFVVGRATYYDDDFEAFSPDETDQFRLWGAVGIKAHTTIQRINDGVESRFFDLHRLRHLIEPSVTVFNAQTTIDRGDLPIFDQEVESLIEGTVVRFAVDQTWSTQRGGPGRWHSVDVFELRSEVVMTSGTGTDATIGRFFDFRPELSSPGDFVGIDGVWRATDAMALSASMIYDLEVNQQARSSIGVLLEHSPLSATSVELRFINPIDSTFVDLVHSEQLGDKYSFLGSLSYDVDESDIKRISGEIRREFPAIVIGVGITHDNIANTTSFGISISPKGLGPGLRVQGVGSNRSGTSFGG